MKFLLLFLRLFDSERKLFQIFFKLKKGIVANLKCSENDANKSDTMVTVDCELMCCVLCTGYCVQCTVQCTV